MEREKTRAVLFTTKSNIPARASIKEQHNVSVTNLEVELSFFSSFLPEVCTLSSHTTSSWGYKGGGIYHQSIILALVLIKKSMMSYYLEMELSFFSCFLLEVSSLKKNREQSCHKPTVGSSGGINTKTAAFQ